jgi:hypothetical protein
MLTKRRFQVDVAGKMLCRQEVWWEDRIGLFQKYHSILTVHVMLQKVMVHCPLIYDPTVSNYLSNHQEKFEISGQEIWQRCSYLY